MSRLADLIIKKDLSEDEQLELRRIIYNLEGITNDLGSIIGASGTVTRLRAGNVLLDNAGMHTYLGGAETGRIEADGDFLLGSNIGAAATTSFAVFTNAQTYNSESIGAGDLLIGDNSSGKANILWDKSTGKLLFRGGTTTQGYIDTDGTAVFGGGHVEIDVGGIAIQTGQATTNMLTWEDIAGSDATGYGQIYTYHVDTTPDKYGYMILKAGAESGGANMGILALQAYDAGNVKTGSFVLTGGEALEYIADAATDNNVTNMVNFKRTLAGNAADGFGFRLAFILDDDSSALQYAGLIQTKWTDVSEVMARQDFFFPNTSTSFLAFDMLTASTFEMIVNDSSKDMNLRVETNNFPYAFGTDGGTDSVYMALDSRGVSGTAYPGVGINTPLPQNLFEIHKTAWDQVADMEEGDLTDFDATSPAGASWDQQADLEEGDITDFDGSSPAWDKTVDVVGDFDAETDTDGDLNDAVAAAHDGANGLEITFDNTTTAYGTMNASAVNQTSVCLSVWFNENDVSLGASGQLNFINLHDGAAAANWTCIYTYAGKFSMQVREDGGGFQVATAVEVGSGWHHWLVLSTRSSSDGADDGTAYLYKDGALVASLTGIDNDTKDWDYARCGMAWTNAASQSGSYYMDTIKIDPIGAPFASKLALKNGNYGLAVPINETTNRYAELTDAAAATAMSAECQIDPNTLTMATNDSFDFMYSPSEFQVALQYDGSNYEVKLTSNLDAGTSSTSAYNISDTYTKVKVEWEASSAPAADDGSARLYIDGVEQEELSGLDSDTLSSDEVRFGCNNLEATTYGVFYLDDCKSANEVGIGSAPEASADAKKNGSYGALFNVETGANTYGQFTDPASETIVVAECWIDPNTITMGANETFTFIAGDGSNDFYVNLKYSSGYYVNATAVLDSGTSATSDYAITDAFHHVRVIWAAASAAAADDGYIYLFVDGVLQEAKTSLDNDTKNIGTVEFGAAAGVDAGTQGDLYLDDCKWRSAGGIHVKGGGALCQSAKTLSAEGPTDDFDVTDANVVFIDTGSNNVTLGGLSGGHKGQVIHIVVKDATNNFTIENNEGGATQAMFLHAGADEVMTAEYGGWTLVCDGTDWHDISHAKHV